MLIKVLNVIIVFVVVAIVLIDTVPVFLTWLGRIHIGRYSDTSAWNKAITRLGIHWLNNTPKIKVTDNTRLVLLDIVKGNYTRDSIQYWQEAALLLGLSEYIKFNEDQEAKNEVLKFLKTKFDINGQWVNKPQNVDAAILAYSLMKLDFLEIDNYKQALDYTWELIKEHIGEDGTVAYRKSMKGYRYVDTIGFTCPFLVLYGSRYNKSECLELAMKQIQNYVEYGMLNKFFIPCHAYKKENAVPMGLYGWGRGLGWFAIGVIDAWREMPNENGCKIILEEIILNFSKTVLEFQQPNGSWNWVVTRTECRPDSSATATLGWFMLNAAGIKDISKECMGSADKAVKYLMTVTRRNGAIDFSQGDTKDIGVYSMLFNTMPFAQGFAIRLVNRQTNKMLPVE